MYYKNGGDPYGDGRYIVVARNSSGATVAFLFVNAIALGLKPLVPEVCPI